MNCKKKKRIATSVPNCSAVSDSLQPRWTVARQVPLPMEFSRQKYWSGLLLPSPEDVPDPGTELTSPALEDGFFTNEPSLKNIQE